MAHQKKKGTTRCPFSCDVPMKDSDPRGLGDLTLRLATEREDRAVVGPQSELQRFSAWQLTAESRAAHQVKLTRTPISLEQALPFKCGSMSKKKKRS